MSVIPNILPAARSGSRHDGWLPMPRGWRLVLSDRLLWLTLGASFVVHLVILAPQYGIRIPHPDQPAVVVSFKRIGPPAIAPQNQKDYRQKSRALRAQQRTTTATIPRITEPQRSQKTTALSSTPKQIEAAPATATTGNNLPSQNSERRVRLTPGMKDYRYSQYLEDWRRKVERIGAMNYPEEARGQFFGSLVLSVALRPDGSIDRLMIVRSSGNKTLDEAAKRIVTMAAPFPPFPPDIRQETDFLDITRTWNFTRGNTLETR